ncbi:ATP-dependent DNA helicase [Trichonephila clavipes]|uniref:ATP-dependent DNA helicase n=1 Tax=Trichonephila clavipes TaxID=2585209 RepID=A0A8X6V8N7_TRICX|nr:ATP-dependent DNA helicase [Trichonephila clavipes]
MKKYLSKDKILSPPKTTLTAFFHLCQNDTFARTLLYSEVLRYYTWNTSKKEWHRRIQGTPVENQPGVKASDALGRVYTVHVTNLECFCLRMLLHHVRGPTSFTERKIVNGQECQTYREACEARRLLENDNHWETMKEAVQCRSPDKIRELYATLLSSCGLSNPRTLWDKYKEYMADDILHQLQQVHTDMTFNQHIYNETLIIIENKVFTIVGKILDDFGMQSPRRDNKDNFNNEIARELDYDFIALQHQAAELVPQLLPEQIHVFHQVLRKIDSGNGGLFFLDAPGGTGKTFLLNSLLMSVRKDKKIAVAVVSSGIAVTLLNGGRTAHSVLKLPLNLAQEDSPICNFSNNSSRGKMLLECKFLVRDESTMSHKKAIEALNRTLEDLRDSIDIMGGMVVLLAGDFRQTLPVIQRGTPADEIQACIKSSNLWLRVEKLSLKTNMRVHLHNDVDSGLYAEMLLKIGDGCLEVDAEGCVSLYEENLVENDMDLTHCSCFSGIATKFEL